MEPVVIFVDDEKNVLSSLERLLIRENYKKYFCNSASEALEVFTREKVHLIVSDLRMPEMNGLELLKIVRQKYPDTIRMVLSGTSESNVVIDSINKGEIFRYLTKPLQEVGEIRAVIRQALEFYAAHAREKALLEELRLSNAELTVWKDRMAYELSVAEKLQLKLLGVPPVKDASFAAAFAYQPSCSISGDFFDLIGLPDGGFCVYIGDVSGHGVGAALVSTLLKLTASDYVRQYYKEGPATVCRMLNDFMNSHFQDSGIFSTFFLAFYDAASRHWTACNCGHPTPMLFDASGMLVADRISVDGTIPLGFFESGDHYKESVQISWQGRPGEVYFFFTDGLYEARDSQGEMFGFEQLQHTTHSILAESSELPEPALIISSISKRNFDCSGDDCCAILVKTL